MTTISGTVLDGRGLDGDQRSTAEASVCSEKDIAECASFDMESAHAELHALDGNGELASIRTGASVKIWYPFEYPPDVHATITDSSSMQPTETASGSGLGQITLDEASASEQIDKKVPERVLFFPNRFSLESSVTMTSTY